MAGCAEPLPPCPTVATIRGINHMCWHKWGKWADKARLEIHSTIHQGIRGFAIEQERRCTKCNKVQIRINRT